MLDLYLVKHNEHHLCVINISLCGLFYLSTRATAQYTTISTQQTQQKKRYKYKRINKKNRAIKVMCGIVVHIHKTHTKKIIQLQLNAR